MERVVWHKGEFELIENSFEEKPVYYFEHIHSDLITKTFKSYDAAIKAKDEGKLKFDRRHVDSYDVFINPEEHGMQECGHCNGYGSSLYEDSDRCTKCGGSGLVRKKTS